MSASESGRRAGQPSMTTPTAAPWLSPQVDIVKSFPKVLGIPSRQRWAAPRAPQAANLEAGGNIPRGEASYTTPFTIAALCPLITAPNLHDIAPRTLVPTCRPNWGRPARFRPESVGHDAEAGDPDPTGRGKSEPGHGVLQARGRLHRRRSRRA